MKLVRWPAAAVTAYVVYRYTIGKKAKGQDVFATPDDESGEAKPEREKSASRPRKAKPRAKQPK